MKLLLDTHAFLFAISDPDQLSLKVRDLFLDPATERWLSTVSLWEIAVKVQIGKLSMPLQKQFYAQHIHKLKAKTLAVELRHSLAMFELPMHHRDPFDRLLIAQAREDGFTLATRDEAFQAYAVETVW